MADQFSEEFKDKIENHEVLLKEIMEEFSLVGSYLPADIDQCTVTRTDANRPGLALAGFYKLFETQRVQIIGRAEYTFLDTMAPDKRRESIHTFFSKKPVAVVICQDLPPTDEMLSCAEEFKVPLLSYSGETTYFIAALISSLNVKLAPRITRHGVFVEVYGEGLLIFGDSGIGKSETAIELVKRGHRLVADDAVEIKKVSAKTLIGTSPEMIRHYIELRGIGIVDVRRIFGMGAVKLTEKIDLIINLEPWDKNKFYDRLGLDTEFTEIMGIQVPSITIPVRPGRNLAIILEIAAMNNRQKKWGYNTALEFTKMVMGENQPNDHSFR